VFLRNKAIDVFRELEELNQWGQTPLHAAINSNNVEIVDLFLSFWQKMNMDINIPDNYGWTVLHFAVSSSSGNASDEDILSLLLNYPGILVRRCQNLT
jgi:ankyrin repeat protein